MNRFVASMLVLVLQALTSDAKCADDTVARAQSMKEKLIGTWHGKMEFDEKKAKALFGANLDKDVLDAAVARIKDRISAVKMELTFSPDGSHRSTETGGGRNRDEKSTWTVVKEDERKKTITIKTVDRSENEETLTITFISQDEFTLHVKELERAPVKDPTFTRITKKSEKQDPK